MKTKTAVLNGKPDAGNPHVRFDEGEVASYPPTVGRPEGVARGAKPRRGSLLYKTVSIAAVICVMTVVSAVAGEKIPAAQLTEPLVYTNAQGATIPYRFAAPKAVEAGKKYPLVILFHGAGERGTNNVAQLVHGATDILNYMRERGIEGYFIAGQCPAGRQWVDTPSSLMAHRMPAKPSESLALMIELIEKTMKELPVDRNQVLVTGISQGGYGTWDIVQRHPDWFAAAMPCCGGGDVTLAWKIRGVPIWAFHGDQDWVVPFKRSRDMVAALWAVDGNVRYREYPGVGHNCWSPTYADWDNVLAWFFAQRRASDEADVAHRGD